MSTPLVGAGRRRAARWLVVAGALGVPASPARAQEPGVDALRHVTVRVRQIAGNNVYLDVGSAHGVVTGDTIPVARDSAGPAIGRLVVVAGTEIRSVLTFAEAPFQVTQGAPLTLLLRRPATRPTPDRARPYAPRTTSPAPGAAPERPESAHGVVALDVTTLHSSTRFGGVDPEEVTRTFATPALRLSATVPDAVGGFDLTTHARLAYRYSDAAIFGDALSPRVYTAALEKDFTSVPIRLGLGRFHGPTESFSGYWDGLYLRWGPTDIGATVLLGFQPDLWNEGPSTDLPKASVVVDWERADGGRRWRGDVSVHTVLPREAGMPDHTFLGLRQSLRRPSVRLDQDLQLDRLPGGQWRLGRLRLQGSVVVAPAVDLRAGIQRRRTWHVFLLDPLSDSPLGPVRDRVSLGLSIRPGSGWLSVDASASRRDGGGDGYGVTTSFGTATLPFSEAGRLTGSAAWWSGERGHTLSVSPGVSVPVGDGRLRTTYRFYRSVHLSRTTTRHGADLTMSAPLAPRLSATLRIGGLWGGDLRHERLDVGLTKSF